MVIVMLGPPASGKGTQSEIAAQQTGLPHISTGELFRHEMANNTPYGQEARKYIDKGLLVPCRTTIKVLKQRIGNPDCENGFILDGFPRTLEQQEKLEVMFHEMKREKFIVINLQIPDDEVIRRISGRRLCGQCGRAFHVDTVKPKVEGVCDYCGGSLIVREDDTPEIAKIRLNEYKEQSEPIIEVYEKQGVLININGDQSQDDVTTDVLEVVSKCVPIGMV